MYNVHTYVCANTKFDSFTVEAEEAKQRGKKHTNYLLKDINHHRRATNVIYGDLNTQKYRERMSKCIKFRMNETIFHRIKEIFRYFMDKSLNSKIFMKC